MESAAPTRVLLGDLEPIMVVGLRRVLAEDGFDVVGAEEDYERIVAAAERLRPDVVVLDLDAAGGEGLGREIRLASPGTKVVLWARNESVMEVHDPESSVPRLVAVTVPEGLRAELSSSRHRQRVEE